MNKPSMTAVIQARMGSARFPGKTLFLLSGKPLIEYLLERLKRSSHIQRIILATSTEENDNAIAEYAKRQNLECFRGDLQNVALRFKQVLDAYHLSSFLRLSGDSPLLDPELVDQAIERFNAGKWDIVTNISPRSYPRGQSVEVLSASAFLRGYELMREKDDFEHVTPYFYRHPEEFKINRMLLEGPDNSTKRLAVDSVEDLKNIESILARLGPRWVDARLDEIMVTAEANA